MMAKRINVSFPHADFGFCESRNLSPSKLLQERITQIRDEQNPQLRKDILMEQHHNLNLRKKLEHFNLIITTLGEEISKRYGDDTMK